MPDEELVALLKQILANQERQHSENVKRGEHVVETVDQTKELFEAAFPGGDADGHKRYHETVIRKMETNRRFIEDMRVSLARWGLVGLVGFIGMAVWTYFQSRMLAK